MQLAKRNGHTASSHQHFINLYPCERKVINGCWGCHRADASGLHVEQRVALYSCEGDWLEVSIISACMDFFALIGWGTTLTSLLSPEPLTAWDHSCQLRTVARGGRCDKRGTYACLDTLKMLRSLASNLNVSVTASFDNVSSRYVPYSWGVNAMEIKRGNGGSGLVIQIPPSTKL